MLHFSTTVQRKVLNRHYFLRYLYQYHNNGPLSIAIRWCTLLALISGWAESRYLWRMNAIWSRVAQYSSTVVASFWGVERKHLTSNSGSNFWVEERERESRGNETKVSSSFLLPTNFIWRTSKFSSLSFSSSSSSVIITCRKVFRRMTNNSWELSNYCATNVQLKKWSMYRSSRIIGNDVVGDGWNW